jgi:cyclopropane fatty-acyl-phospholipid synthase-like methyltransferase
MQDIAQRIGQDIAVDGIYSDGAYLAQNPSWHVEDSPWKARHIERILRQNAITPRSVAEVGCGAGEILVQLQKAFPNSDFSGFEVSPQAFALCRQRESARIHFHLKDLLEEETPDFDVLLAIDVFEHIDDYLGFLKKVRNKARYKVFHIPLDLSLQTLFRVNPILKQRDTVGHLHYFFKDTALATLKYCGYEVIDSFYTAAGVENNHLSLGGRLLKLPRKLLFNVNADMAVRILGGYSLLVLAQ